MILMVKPLNPATDWTPTWKPLAEKHSEDFRTNGLRGFSDLSLALLLAFFLVYLLAFLFGHCDLL